MIDSSSSEDVEMEDVGGQSKRRLIVGDSDLKFKRDGMEIKPLFSETGMRKSGE